MGWEWHMQIICTKLHTDNHASTSSLNFLQVGCSSWCLTNSVKSTEGKSNVWTRSNITKTKQNTDIAPLHYTCDHKMWKCGPCGCITVISSTASHSQPGLNKTHLALRVPGVFSLALLPSSPSCTKISSSRTSRSFMAASPWTLAAMFANAFITADETCLSTRRYQP